MRMAPSSACSTSMLCGARRCSGRGSAGCRRAVDSRAMVPQRFLVVCVEIGTRHSTAYTRNTIGTQQHSDVAGSRRSQPNQFGWYRTETQIPLSINQVARDRNNALPFRELDMEHHHILSAERHFRRSKIKLPHAHEALIIEALRLLSVSVETLTPGLQRVGIVQAQDFDVGNE